MSHLRRWAVGCVAMLFVGAAATDRVVAAEPDLTAARRVAREAEAKLLAGLHKPVKAEWSNVPVEQVLDSLAKTAGVNLWIDREALSADGISLVESVVDLHLGEATVWQTLHFLLKPLLLDWHGSDGVLAITTQARTDEIFITQEYKVKAIVEALEPRSKAIPPNLRKSFHYQRQRIGLPLNGAAGYPIEMYSMGIPIRELSIRTDELLCDLLTDCIGPNWESRDGQGGSISIGHGQLILRQTHRSQLEVAALLQAVEEFAVKGTKARSLRVARPGYPHDEDAAIFKRLAEPQAIDIKAAVLDRTLAQLANEGRYRLWIDKESLSADGIALDEQVTLKLSGTTLDTVLRKLLDPLLLTVVVEEGTLVVTTAVKAAEMQTIRVCFTGDIPEARSAFDLLSTIQEATSGKWEDVDGEGGNLWKIVPEWLVVHQTQACHLEIAQLFDDLRRPAAPLAEVVVPGPVLRLYPVDDESAIDNLVNALPRLIPEWDAKQGLIVRLGHSIAIKQPARIHEQLDGVFGAINQAHARLNPPQPKVEPKPAPAPATK